MIVSTTDPLGPCDLTRSDTVGIKFDFPDEEHKVIQLWREIDAFQTSKKLREGCPEFSFYDGPPFATGLPHYGHLLAGTVKVRVLSGHHYHDAKKYHSGHCYSSC
jgi:isoleucyl-tRNA synthetase